MDELAKEYRDEQAVAQALALAETIEKVPQLMNLIVDQSLDDDSTLGAFRKKAFRIISESDIPLVSQMIENAKPDHRKYHGNRREIREIYTDDHWLPK